MMTGPRHLAVRSVALSSPRRPLPVMLSNTTASLSILRRVAASLRQSEQAV
jgi:hypothetical protein